MDKKDITFTKLGLGLFGHRMDSALLFWPFLAHIYANILIHKYSPELHKLFISLAVVLLADASSFHLAYTVTSHSDFMNTFDSRISKIHHPPGNTNLAAVSCLILTYFLALA